MADLEPNLTTDVNKESLTKEVDSLSERKEKLISEIDENTRESRRLNTIMANHENGLKREKETEINYKESLEYLTRRKQEMAAFENIETETEKLKGKIQQLNVDTGSNKNFLDIIKKVKEDVESINMTLDTAARGYDTVFNEFKHLLLISEHNI